MVSATHQRFRPNVTLLFLCCNHFADEPVAMLKLDPPDDAALDLRAALGDTRSLHLTGGRRGQPRGLEFVAFPARMAIGVADVCDGDADPQGPKGKVDHLVDRDHVAACGHEHDWIRRQQIEHIFWGLWGHAGEAVPTSVFDCHWGLRASS